MSRISFAMGMIIKGNQPQRMNHLIGFGIKPVLLDLFLR